MKAPGMPTLPAAGVIATSPATAPEAAPSIEGLPLNSHSKNVQLTVAAAVAMVATGVYWLGGRMAARGRGGILVMSSLSAFQGSAYVAAYAATKAAIDAYSQTLQMELAGSPVHVTVVRLATVAGTDFFRKYVPVSRMPRSKRSW